MFTKEFRQGTLFQLLVPGRTAAHIVEDWMIKGTKTDLRLRRAKTRGKVVIETTDTLFAANIVQLYGAKVNIKEPIEKL